MCSTRERGNTVSKLPKNNITLGYTRYKSQRRQIAVRRVDASGSTFINPIERWTDNNYAPYELDYVYNQNTETSQIIAPLHGYRAQDVHVAITRGYIIILLSDDEDIVCPFKQEFYCEIPLPPDVNKHDAVVEIDTHFLTIHLARKQLFWKRVATAAFRCRNSFAFLFGKNWKLGRLDD
jgi:hypothetical protein